MYKLITQEDESNYQKKMYGITIRQHTYNAYVFGEHELLWCIYIVICKDFIILNDSLRCAAIIEIEKSISFLVDYAYRFFAP